MAGDVGSRAPEVDMSQSQAARRMELLRAPVQTDSADPLSERRIQLLRGEVSDTEGSPSPVQTELSPSNQANSEGQPQPSDTPRPQVTRQLEVSPSPPFQPEGEPTVSPTLSPSKNAPPSPSNPALPAPPLPPSEADLQLPLLNPQPDSLPPDLSPATGTGSATDRQVQAMPHLSESHHPNLQPPQRTGPPRPQRWRWMVFGALGASAFMVTLLVLSNRRGKDNPKPDPAPPLQADKSAAERAMLLQGLKDPKLNVRRDSAEKLRAFKGDDVVAALADRVADDYWPESPDANGSDRAEALLTLRLLDKTAIPKALQKAMKSANDRVRIWACNEIIHTADVKLAPVLISALNDANSRVRVLAADGLRQLHWNNKEVIVALSKRVGEPWVPRVQGTYPDDLSDPRNSGREAATEALLILDREQGLAALEKAIKSTSSNLRVWASGIQSRVLGKKSPP
jgi:hypothetical protein